jgi:hypothetical protein
MSVRIEDGTKEYWTTLRNLASVSAESAVPQASGFVTLDWAGPLPEEVEIRFDAISTTGSPDEVIYSVWRNLGGKVDKISNITILAADFAAPIPNIIRFDGVSLWVTASFTGGAAPTVTNLVQYRVIK